MHPQHSRKEIDDLIHNADAAARIVLEDVAPEDVGLRELLPLDMQKFDGAKFD